MYNENETTLTGVNEDVRIVDLAMEMSNYTEEEIQEVCNQLNDEQLAKILEQCDEKVIREIIKSQDNTRILRVFSYMAKDDIVDILGIIDIGNAKDLIKLMKEGDQTEIRELLGYKEDSAGGIMTTEYISIYNSLTVAETIRKIKEIAPKTELIDTIFLMNKRKQLVGTVELRDLFIADENEKLTQIANNNFIYVEPETDQEEVALLASKYDLKVIPVLNKRKVMLGIITIDDIVDVMVEEQTEDVLQMGGVDKEERLDSTVWQSVKMRFPWLFINLITAFLAAMTVKVFESTIAQVVALSSIMSIVTGMGGNAGTQTISIIIRNIAMGKVKLKDTWKLLLKEFLLGVIDGAGIGLITGIVVYFMYGNIYLGLIIFIAMIENLIIAGIAGLLIPIVLHKLHFDPALSSSIFLTTATDVLGFFFFLSLAKLFLPLLV